MRSRFDLALILPAAVFTLAFFIVSMGQLTVIGATGPDGLAAYATVLTNPRHGRVMLATLTLSACVTVTTLVLATAAALFSRAIVSRDVRSSSPC